MISQWSGKTALITGAGSGIGRAVSLELARRGAIVYVTGIEPAENDAVVAEIAAEGGQAVSVELDVTCREDLQSAIGKLIAERGSLDMMMNNAGVIYAGEYYEMDEDFLINLVNVNLTAVMMGTLFAYRVMKAQGHGLIVNTASQGGLIPVSSMAAYSASKFGVVGLSESVGAEAEAFGVDIKTVCPGNVKSELLAKGVTEGSSADEVLADLPKLMTAEAAAVVIVDGLGSKKDKILFPWYAHLLYFLSRVWPRLGRILARLAMERFRASRAR